MTEWAFLNRLSGNVNKTFLILYTNSHVNNDFAVAFGGDANAYETSSSFLGIFVDDNLKFDKHISKICSILSESIGIMFKLRSYELSAPKVEPHSKFQLGDLILSNNLLPFTIGRKGQYEPVHIISCSRRDVINI